MNPPAAAETRLAWITGAGGLIGHHLVQAAPRLASHWRVLALTRAQLDLTDFAAIDQLARTHPPHLILHCAAISRSAVCQHQPSLARQINVNLTAHLAHLAPNTPFFFFSSDLVFDGTRGHYTETDPVNPLSVYGETKAEAEALVLRNPLHTVIRTSLNGGTSPTGDRGFNEQMRLAWSQSRTLTLFTDEFRCPIPAPVTAQAVWKLVRIGATGLFHLAGAEKLSRWELGQLLASRWPTLNPRITPASIRTHPDPRPADCSLNCSTIQGLLPFPLPSLRQWLANHPDTIF